MTTRHLTPGGLSYSLTSVEAAGQHDQEHVQSAAILLVHGWCCRAADYDEMREKLIPLLLRTADPRPASGSILARLTRQSEYTIIQPDLPGHGSSPLVCRTRLELEQARPAPDQRSVDRCAELLVDLVTKECRMRRVFLVGHSLGGRVVLEIWRRAQLTRSEQGGGLDIPGIVLLDCSSHRFRPTSTENLPEQQGQQTRQTESDKYSLLRSAECAFSVMFHPQNTPTTFSTSTLAHVRSRDYVSLARLRGNMIDYDLQRMDMVLEKVLDASDLSGTKMINLQSSDVVGLPNIRVSLRKGQRTPWMKHLDECCSPMSDRQQIPQLRLEHVIIEDSLHFPHVDFPAKIAEIVARFVQGCDG